MNSTLIAVASIPPRIWEQDKDIWKAFLASRKVSSWQVKEAYKRALADFYHDVEKPIKRVTEQDLNDYANSLAQTYRPNTVATRMSPIRNYWKFARTQSGEASQ